MKNHFFRALMFLGFAAFSAYVSSQTPQVLFTIPEISDVALDNAQENYTLLPSGAVVVKGNAQTVAQAKRFAADFQTLTGRTLKVVRGKKAAAGNIVLELQPKLKFQPEEYEITIGSQVLVQASNPKGLWWGLQTVLQMLETSQDGTLLKGKYHDKPEYALRGFMIDCGRKYIPLSYLRQLVRIMSYYKMNTLQVHLNDNGFKQYFEDDWNKTQSAFRMECETFPGLTAKDGSYGKEEFRAFQKYADSLGVEIIPEIDVPAHALAFTQYRPDLASKEYGADHLDLFNPETEKFCDALFKEYLEGKNPVFCGPHVCIGTDEYSNAKQEVTERFRAFTDHYIRFVESFGKKVTLWGSLTHAKGETPIKSEGVLMKCWSNGYAQPAEMKKLGYQLVSIPDGWVYIVPAAGYYYDYLNTRMLYEKWTPANINGAQFEENDPAIEGGMFAVWNDHVGNGVTVKDIHHRVFPALQTMAAKCWSGATCKISFDTFNKKSALMHEAPGVNELARLSAPLEMSEVKPNATLDVKEVGFGNSVEFTVEANGQEEKGTVLFESENAKFYLSDPQSGLLAYEHEGYLNKFNYRLPASGKVTIRVECTNTETKLFVNDRLRETHGRQQLQWASENNRLNVQTPENKSVRPTVYVVSRPMFYLRTLFFPLHHSGNFKAHVTNLRVKPLK